jgi:hypothetical protein
MKTYIGLWDCKTCGEKGKLGPETFCDGCGATRPKNVVFYVAENDEGTDDDTHKQQAQAGADWVCGHCRSYNKAWQFGCQACGNPKDATSGDVELAESDYVENPVVETPPPPRKKRWLPVWVWVLLGIGLAMFLFSRGCTKTMVVQELSWEAKVPLQHLELHQTESFSLPANALNVNSRQVQDGSTQQIVGHSTRTREVKVQTGNERYVCGKINKGNGYFVDKFCTRPTYGTRTEHYEEPNYISVPIYRKKYFYSINDWVTKETLTQSGKKETFDAPLENPKQGDASWRIASVTKNCVVVFKDGKDQTFRKIIPRNEWDKLKEGDKMDKKVGLFSDKIQE